MRASSFLPTNDGGNREGLLHGQTFAAEPIECQDNRLQDWERSGGGPQGSEPANLKTPEWEIFSQPSPAYNTRDFRLRAVPPPEGYTGYFEKIVLAEKLREVRALIGFTRLESAYDFDTPTELPVELRAPLALKKSSSS